MMTNSYKPDEAAAFVRRFMKLEADFQSEKGTLMQALKEDKETLMEQAEAAGVPKKILKLEIERRKGDAKIREKYERLDTDERDQLDLFSSAVARGMGDDTEWQPFEVGRPVGELVNEVVEKAAEAKASADKPKAPRKSTKTEDRIAQRAKAVGMAPADDGQTDIEAAAKAAAERDAAEADDETKRFMDTSTNERVAEPAA